MLTVKPLRAPPIYVRSSVALGREDGILGIPISGKTALLILTTFAVGVFSGYLMAQN